MNFEKVEGIISINNRFKNWYKEFALEKKHDEN